MSDYEARYRRAEAISQLAVNRVVRNGLVYPHWIDGHPCFWYEHDLPGKREIRLVNAKTGTNEPAFDVESLAAQLRATGHPGVDSNALELDNLRVTLSPKQLSFSFVSKAYRYDVAAGKLTAAKHDTGRPDWTVSPDRQRALFIRDDNLWLRDLATGTERALTHDGERWYPYCTQTDMKTHTQAGGRLPQPPRGHWSADSKRFFTLRTDDRKVTETPYIAFAPTDGSLAPKVIEQRFALPGDLHVPEMGMLVVDVATGAQVAAQWAPVPTVRMSDSLFESGLAWWGSDESKAYFVDVERGERRATVVEFDTRTGRCRPVFSEETGTYLELGANVYGRTNVHYVKQSHELIWYSERSGQAHLYLYDLSTGSLRHALTSGSWRVRDVVRVDPERREVWFSVSGLPGSRTPTHLGLARTSLDAPRVVFVTHEDAEHYVLSASDFDVMAQQMMGMYTADVSGLSPDGNFVVDTFGTVDTLPATVLRDREGRVVMEIAKAEVGELPFTLRYPQPFSALAADGVTPLYGVMYLPSDFSPDKRYPVIDYVYGGPQISNVPNLAFSGLMSSSASQMLGAYAELGFVVLAIDGRGVAARDRNFREHSYGHLERGSDVHDHVAVIRQLAQRHAFIDLDRVGVYGFSGGGYATSLAMLMCPDFYKVGVAAAGNHDQRLMTHTWGERYQGIPPAADYTQQAAAGYAANLRGKLLFVHGLLDGGVHPSAMFQLTEALMAANKDFDLLLLPNLGHELNSYAIRRIWDYFVLHLAGGEPPRDIRVRHGQEVLLDQVKARMARAAAAAAAPATAG